MGPRMASQCCLQRNRNRGDFPKNIRIRINRKKYPELYLLIKTLGFSEQSAASRDKSLLCIYLCLNSVMLECLSAWVNTERVSSLLCAWTTVWGLHCTPTDSSCSHPTAIAPAQHLLSSKGRVCRLSFRAPATGITHPSNNPNCAASTGDEGMAHCCF